MLSAFMFRVVQKEGDSEEASDPRPHFLFKVCAWKLKMLGSFLNALGLHG